MRSLERNVPARPIDQLDAFARQLHRERRDWAKRVRNWQTVALSAMAGALLVVIGVLAWAADKLSNLERAAFEVAHQLRLTQEVVLDMQAQGQQLAGDVQRLEWRLDRSDVDMQ